MSFRTILIESRCKLEYSLNHLIYRNGNVEKRILLSEIKTIIVDSLQVSITSNLLSELIKNKIKVIFVDEKHNPIGELTPFQNNFYSYRKIKTQISFSEHNKNYLWQKVVTKKIINQAKVLCENSYYEAYDKLLAYALEVEEGDKTNREGHAAKVYFNALFGDDFSRDDESNTNKFLNYGYSIILSAINREIKILGYLTELGIHHIGESNPFNLSCDLMEPIRPLIDSLVKSGMINDENFKKIFAGILTKKVQYNNKEFFLDNAIRLYIEDMFNYLINGDEEKIRFIEYEL